MASFPRGFGNLPAAPFLTGGRGNRTLHILRSRGIGTVLLGEPAPKAVAALTQLLGAPAHTNVPTSNCGIDHESVWTSPTVADPLTVFERSGRFVGYQYGAPVDQIGLQLGPGVVLTTPTSLMLGDTIGVAKRLYPTGFNTHPARGVGRWGAVGNGGTLYGYVLPTIYPLRVVTDNDRSRPLTPATRAARPGSSWARSPPRSRLGASAPGLATGRERTLESERTMTSSHRPPVGGTR